MALSELILWPGTRICKYLGVDPESDAGLIRSMFNMIVYLVIFLSILWLILA